jgi:hypothetical protein
VSASRGGSTNPRPGSRAPRSGRLRNPRLKNLRRPECVASWRKCDTLPKQEPSYHGFVILFGSGRRVATIATVLALAGGAAFAASWFVGRVTGGAGR